MAQIQLIEATGYAQGRSTTSLAIGTGTKAWVLDRHIAFVAGMAVTADAGSGNTMSGAVTGYDRATLTLSVAVDSTAGSGTHASWTIGGERTIRLSTGRGYARAANFYAPKLAAKINVQRALNRDGITFGASEIGYGTVDLINMGDGNPGDDTAPMDELRTLTWSGRALRILSGDDKAAYGTFTTLIDGTAERILYPNKISARWLWRDPMALLDRPVLSERWAGTTTGATSGQEGGAEMAGVQKQLVIGKRLQVTPQLANASLQLLFVSLSVCALSDVTIAGADQDGGTTVHGSLAALKAATPGDAEVHTFAAAGSGTWLRLGSGITGPVRVTAIEGATSADRTPGQLWARLLEDWTDLSPSIAAADLTALDSAATGEAGILITGEETIRQAADRLAGTAGADYWRDTAGEWRIRQLAEPAGTPALELRLMRPGGRARAAEIQVLDYAVVHRDLLPPSQVTILHSRYAPQTRDELAGIEAADLEIAADLEAEWRRASWPAEPDPTVLAAQPLAEPREFASAWSAAAAAASEAQRRQELLAAGLLAMDVTVPLSDVSETLELGILVKVTMDRHQLDGGGLFSLRGYRTDRQADKVVLELLGVGL